jgi:fructosamine-3-kinase
MPAPQLFAVVERLTGQRVVSSCPLSGGCVGEVLRLTLADGGRLVAKCGPGLEPEAWMLRFLAETTDLPLPALLHGDDDLLLMAHVEGGDPLDRAAQRHAAEILAALHAISWHAFGLERDTVIGGLPQPNPPTGSWIEFFRDHRLLAMAAAAHGAGRLPAATLGRIERQAARLPAWIDEPERPGLVHGDCWSGNVLCRRGRVAALIDPALSFSDPEIELAFGTMFGTFGSDFYTRYHQIRPIRAGFWEIRRDLYTLWPLLVHVRLFGGSYLAGVERVLDRLL